MSTYRERYQEALSEIDARVRDSRAFLERYRPWLQQYKGGLHLGFFAAIAEWESGGRMVAGDPDLGEYGFYQIAQSTEKTFGLGKDTRRTPENNIFLAGLEYNVEAQRLANTYSFVQPGSRDQWMLARLAFAIGRGGTKRLIEGAVAAGYITSPVDVYAKLVEYVDKIGGAALGSQSPEKVWFRVRMIPVIWAVGEKAVPGASFGPPVRVPAPMGLAYTLPKGIELPSEGGALLFAVVALGLSLLLPG